MDIEEKERLAAVLDAISRLRPRERDVLWSLYFRGLNYRNTANLIGKTATRVRQIQEHALHRLRHRYNSSRLLIHAPFDGRTHIAKWAREHIQSQLDEDGQARLVDFE